MGLERYPNRLAQACLVTAALIAAGDARALDKQGSAHGGSVEGRDSGFDVSGSLLLGSALYNPTYAARPDNSGLAFMRYGAHADIDLIGRRLSIPIDLNFFTDRERGGGRIFLPSEGDVILGVTSTWALGAGALELGVRGERDMPLDRGGLVQQYVDARARYLFSLAEELGLKDLGAAEDLRGSLTLGGFVVNPTFPARPDNSGRALLRYAAHLEMELTKNFGIGADTTFFSDRREKNPVAPSELDLTAEVIIRLLKVETHVAYERDMPIDRGGLVQHFAYVTFAVALDADLNRHPAHD
jgi:hypothetical protein